MKLKRQPTLLDDLAGTDSGRFVIIGDIHYDLLNSALTLSDSDIGLNNESGWTIEGTIHEDYFTWVNYFSAIHPEFGKVNGDFEEEVYADSIEGLRHFLEHHPPSCWDYGDI